VLREGVGYDDLFPLLGILCGSEKLKKENVKI
jgi:hypothetical protein